MKNELIIQLDLEGTKVIRTYDNLKEVFKTYRNKAVRTNDVKRCLEKKFKQTGGFQWKKLETLNLVKNK